MSFPSNILAPMVSEIGIGGVGGFLVGYTVKKVAKLVAIALAIGFVGLQYLSYRGVITIDYTILRQEVIKLIGRATGLQSLITDIIIHIPFGASFGLGFYLGLKKG